MDPIKTHFLISATIYFAGAMGCFALGLVVGRAGRARAIRRAVDQAWRMSEVRNRYTDPS